MNLICRSWSISVSRACPHCAQVLLDVGAGNGYFSLAAAARGHDVIAFELSNASLASFEASAKYNGFQKAITLHKVTNPSMLPSSRESSTSPT